MRSAFAGATDEFLQAAPMVSCGDDRRAMESCLVEIDETQVAARADDEVARLRVRSLLSGCCYCWHGL
ncbi:MAG TPA: hypothetical protein VHU84_00060 [Lacipirellulaceae bacterium]|nr:hypothetical protein [Lacipirellulaceae bacterium]